MTSALSIALAALLSVAANAAAPKIDFNRDIRPILSDKCFTCHGPDEAERKGGKKGARLRLDTREGAIADIGDRFAVVPGNAAKSELIKRVKTTDADELMPPPSTGKKLTKSDVALLERWVKEGANYSRHWSYEKPVRPEVPKAQGRGWAKNDVDHFIVKRLEAEKLKPSPEADRAALIRRVSLDLIGLPPTPEEVAEFVKDAAPLAYERLVDRLLSREAFGEHWARLWLDQARYADSAGYADDPARTIWAYRDYVIRSFNANKPFDQFTVEQIAGDLLPNATEEQLIATAFHRNTPTNNEGGTSDEEYRNVAVVDRVNTTMAVWMGTTMACAQCHTHKYDPITQEEYFKVYAILNNTEDSDRTDEAPLHEIWTKELLEKRAALEKEIATVAERVKQVPIEEEVVAHLGLSRQLKRVKPMTTVPIYRELAADKRRKTHIQLRGNFMNLGNEVSPGVPAAFHQLQGEADRLSFAKWLVDENNPLTARVMANRFWESIFGNGLVSTSEDFGLQGELPSHPELVDWLATEFVRLRWDMKALLRLMVTSAAYRQSSRVTPELLARDPDNRLLARGPRFRLSAETIRDQAMATSGLLSAKMYGPPVKPPQPKLGLNAAFGSATDWDPSKGEDRYRRALYTTWRRSNPYPSMATFDAPNREVCTVKRERSNTPLQALVTLNDPVYVEAAQALARRLRGATTEEKIAHAFQLCVSRTPTAQETAKIKSLFESARARYDKEQEKALAMATKPLGPLPDGAGAIDLAAWTVVANVLLNLDETLMKR